MQTDLVRQDFREDMPISRAISIVFERRPDLRLNSKSLYFKCFYFWYSLLKLLMHSGTGWRGLIIRYCNGTCVEWKAGLLQMLRPYHLNAGTRLVSSPSALAVFLCGRFFFFCRISGVGKDLEDRISFANDYLCVKQW